MWIIFNACAAAIVCPIALLLGDKPQRWVTGVVAVTWLWALATRLLSHSFVGPEPADVSDAAASVALTALWLWFRVERIDLFLVAAIQLIQSIMQFVRVDVDGETLHGAYVEYEVLNAALLAVLIAMTLGGRLRRRLKRRAILGGPAAARA